MLIGIDASRANRSLRTGTEWYAFHIIKHLLQVDQKNQYLLYLDAEASPDLVEAVSLYPNVRFKRLAWPWRFFWTLGRLSLEMLVKAPDVLFVPAHSLPLFRPKKTITTIHDIAFIRDEHVYQKKNVKLSRPLFRQLLHYAIKLFTQGHYRANTLDYLRWSTQYALKKAQAIIAVSDFTKNEIIAVYSHRFAHKIHVVHNAYDQDNYRFIPDSLERQQILDKYNVPESFFIYVGRLEKKKNIPALVEAFALFKEKHPYSRTKLLMIGNAGFGYDEVKYIIEEYNLDKDVIMPGWVEEQDLPALFSAALAFVFPTLHEGFGIPVLQAMACKTPALISDLPVLREIVGRAAFYFNPYDCHDILKAMSLIYEDDDLKKELTERGLNRVGEFSWEKAARETLAVIESL